MKKRFIFWIINTFIILCFIFPTTSVPAMPLQGAIISYLSPTSCPAGGCTGGQRFNMRTSFDLGTYQPGLQKNVQICAYTPVDWNVNDLLFNSTGTLSGLTYGVDVSDCGSAPTGYQNSAGVSNTLSNSFFGDTLDFTFRMGRSATSNGSVYLRVYEFNGSNWIQSGQAFIFVPVTPLTQNVFVAQSAEECLQNSPCFINSGDDLPGGIGTGLKDAIDALNPSAVIQIIGNYAIRSQTVAIDKSLTIKGLPQATITSSGYVCDLPMLAVSAGLTLEDIALNDGLCINPNRDLLQIDNSQPINILSSSLTNGRDALLIRQSASPITIQASTISNNIGFAINRLANSGIGEIRAAANNIYGNRNGVQVNCGSYGTVNHNFWGYEIGADTASQNCTFQAGKQLGSPILSSISTTGLQVEKVTVGFLPQSYFENQVSVSHAVSEPDFELFIVNHGSSSSSIPFASTAAMTNLVPCSNFYDVFLANSATITSTLNLSIRYNLNNACTATIESNSYCGQSDPTLFPLWWIDPNQLITSGWDTTGQSPSGPASNGVNGQTTTCDLINKNIAVQIDGSGRPGINADLNFTPFVVAIIGNPAAAVLTNFSAIAGDRRVTLNWQTSSELNTSGFYIQRRLQGTGSFASISPFIPRSGTNTSGAVYTFVDTTVTNINVYDYRLEIVGSDFLSIYSNTISASPAPATQTPTTTVSATITQTLTASITSTTTITPTRTVTRTRTSTRTPSRTSYRAPTLVRTPFRSATPSRTPFPSRTTIFRSTTTTSLTLGIFTPNPDRSSTASTQSGSGDGGYPGPGETDEIDGESGGYPGPDSPQVSTTIDPWKTFLVTPSPNTRHTLTPAPIPGQNDNESNNQSDSNWVYYGLGGMIAICVLLLAGYFLWKKGVLHLPFLS